MRITSQLSLNSANEPTNIKLIESLACLLIWHFVFIRTNLLSPMGKKQVATPQWDKSGPKFGTQKYFTVQQEQGGTVMSMSANARLDTENASAVE